MKTKKVVLTGGAGLVGQNLVNSLRLKGYSNIVVLDKHRANLEVLREFHPEIVSEYADLADSGDWQGHFKGADSVVMLHAQIGGLSYHEFWRNNIEATRLVLETIKTNQVSYLIHISSSVVQSVADDFYTKTKDIQEKMVLSSGVNCVVLRPTLMFGWFDRKHLGWLARFMKRIPIFPVPGNGRYIRQPLYVANFCDLIINCIETRHQSVVFNISGYERIAYIDIVHEVKRVIGSKTVVLCIPYRLFYFLLWLWSLFDKSPPFTTQQLAALVSEDEFELIDWATIFGVAHTPFIKAINETFNHPVYSKVHLDF
jgi:nucleoside-diphosphate-sugar epimerase